MHFYAKSGKFGDLSSIFIEVISMGMILFPSMARLALP
jgi:hypothetical protein